MSKLEVIKERIAGLKTFPDIQAEIGVVMAEIERQAEICRDARADRDKTKNEYENKLAIATIDLRAEMPDETAKMIEHHATVRCSEASEDALDAETDFRRAEVRMEVLRDYLKALEILCNNMRAELRYLHGQAMR